MRTLRSLGDGSSMPLFFVASPSFQFARDRPRRSRCRNLQRRDGRDHELDAGLVLEIFSTSSRSSRASRRKSDVRLIDHASGERRKVKAAKRAAVIEDRAAIAMANETCGRSGRRDKAIRCSEMDWSFATLNDVAGLFRFHRWLQNFTDGGFCASSEAVKAAIGFVAREDRLRPDQDGNVRSVRL